MQMLDYCFSNNLLHMKKIVLLFALFSFGVAGNAAYLLIPMDETQTDHLRAYGIAWKALEHETDVQWLLNYRGGSYLFKYDKEDEFACLEKGVSFETLPDVQARSLIRSMKSGKENTAVIDMERAPKIAVYAPAHAEAWDDAVINTLTYAGIPFDVLYDTEVLRGDLSKYDWLHLHHEDFTGQHNRVYNGFNKAQWYRDEVASDEATARAHGFAKVSQLKLAVTLKMKLFVSNGGFLFAMCSATETFDIALAAEKTDIAGTVYDGDAYDSDYQSKLNFENCLAFAGFNVKANPMDYVHSDIDTYGTRMLRGVNETNDFFALNAFDVHTQTTQAMLVQNHTTSIKGFWGATTGFDLSRIKSGVDILAGNSFAAAREARYIHGHLGKGMWTYYAGHDPGDYQHRFEEPAPDMNLHGNSPGYRLILNNVLFQSTRTIEETHQSFSAYPSPASTSFTVNYTLDENATGMLSIYDATGKAVHTASLAEGTTTATVDVSSLPAGNYIWRVECGNKSLFTDRFSVSH
jgi:hypothetical protein